MLIYNIMRKVNNSTIARQVTYNKTETLTYFDFIRFLLAEEDKSHPTAIEYWFRIMDLDGDGFISLFELEYFYQVLLIS